ncbi:MAG: hypothetical protein J0L61_11585 [Planctomycetes bacterium]|nr:hypothetical protein [Planctomycetota bacterium]
MSKILAATAIACFAGSALAMGQDPQIQTLTRNSQLLEQQYNPNRVAGVTVWDTMYGTAPSTTGGSPRTYIGGAIGSLGNAAGSGPITLTGLDCTMVNTTGATINNIVGIRLNVTIWGAYTGLTGAADLVFGSQLAQASADFTLTTPLSLATNTYIPFGNDFAAGPSAALAGIDLSTLNITLPSLTSIAGISFNWQLNTGAGFAPTPAGLTSGLITGGAAQTIGTSGFTLPAGGFFRNAGAATRPQSSYSDGNFINSDGRTFATNNTAAAFRLYATPTPGAASLLGVAGLVAARRRRA